MAMIRSRNLTSHIYNPALAEEIAGLTIPGLPEPACAAALMWISALLHQG
jgi:hypothetical protein